MSRTKTRQALSILAGLAAVVLIALLANPDAWTLIPSLIVALAVVLASPVDDRADIPNSAVKVWLVRACALGGMVCVVLGVVSRPSLLVAGAVLLGVSLPQLWMIRQGRNPWWMRGWADYSGR
jgi:UDP-N-acetylmuramyl pentapeptide phosphotransferase/UDP-N-acetylglucosamine-1-phosphate transferase